MPIRFVSELESWTRKERKAIELISLVGSLSFEKSVELILFRRKLLDSRSSEILNDHLYAQKFSGLPITIDVTHQLVKALAQLDLAPSKIDIGRLAKEWLSEAADYGDDEVAFLKNKLVNHLGREKKELKPKDVVLFGFGRIGRIAARILISQVARGEQLRLRAIVSRRNSSEKDIMKRASLLRKDSVHNRFRGTIIEDVENQMLKVNGNAVHMIESSNPSEIDYTQYGIDDALLIDNTGLFRDEEGLGNHIEAKGISEVLLTAPGKGSVPNIVYGINHQDFSTDDRKIFSAASCTTNAIVPVIKVIEDNFGLENGHIQTVHAYTNDQNLLDNYHSKYRRGRSAPLNMVITETGAASAVSKVIPSVKGKLTANAVRVPTPNASLAIMTLQLKRKVTEQEINDIFAAAASSGDLVEQIDYALSNELVSSDIVGNSHAAIVDGKATILAPDGKNVALYVWYDNEYGYTEQVIRLAKYLAKVDRLRYF